ncbi:MAG TPA: TolC family protein [archaeon]|nr:TolC family protein [archaeon]
MSLYQTALQHFPSLKSFDYKEQSLRNEYKGLGWQRLVDMDAVTNYYHFSTLDLGRYTSGDFSILNTFDIFNKKGVDRSIIHYEIQKNKSLTDIEKKNVFSMITEAYFALLNNYELLKIHQESLDWIERNILLVNTGVEKGVFPASDINRWTIEKLNRQNSIQADKLGIARAEETLRILTGLVSVTPEGIDQPGCEDVSEENMLKHSPELVVYDLEKKQIELDIVKERRSLYPDLQVGNSLVMNHEPESTGDQYLVSAGLSFKLFDGGRRYRIISDQARIKSIESDQKATRAMLTDFYRYRLQEMNTQKEMLKNLETARSLSTDNLNKLLVGYQKRFIDFTTLFNAFRDDVALRENYENTYIEFNKNCQFLYHLSCGDIYF